MVLLPAGEVELPQGKALFVQLNNQNDQPIAGASVVIKTRNAAFDRVVNPAVSNDTGRVFFLDFSDLIVQSFKELPPVWFEVTWGWSVATNRSPSVRLGNIYAVSRYDFYHTGTNG